MTQRPFQNSLPLGGVFDLIDQPAAKTGLSRKIRTFPPVDGRGDLRVAPTINGKTKNRITLFCLLQGIQQFHTALFIVDQHHLQGFSQGTLHRYQKFRRNLKHVDQQGLQSILRFTQQIFHPGIHAFATGLKPQKQSPLRVQSHLVALQFLLAQLFAFERTTGFVRRSHSQFQTESCGLRFILRFDQGERHRFAFTPCFLQTFLARLALAAPFFLIVLQMLKFSFHRA